MFLQKDPLETKIENALLSGQRKITFNNVEIYLPILKRDTFKVRKRKAEEKAKEIAKLF